MSFFVKTSMSKVCCVPVQAGSPVLVRAVVLFAVPCRVSGTHASDPGVAIQGHEDNPVRMLKQRPPAGSSRTCGIHGGTFMRGPSALRTLQ